MVRIGLFFLGLVVFLVGCKAENKAENIKVDQHKDTLQIVEPVYLYGYNVEDYDIYFDTVREGWTMSHMLVPYNVNQLDINTAAMIAADSINQLNYVKVGKPFAVFARKGDSLKTAQHAVYDASVEDYYVFSFIDSVQVNKVTREIAVETKTLTGEIIQNSNLTLAINQQIQDFTTTAALAEGFENIFAWSIDFFKLQAGDQFKVIYEQKSIENQPYGIGEIKGIWFNHNNDAKYAFLYITDSTSNTKGYYDEEGKEMKRPFLMSPVKFARMTSAYNLKRFHPIYKRTKPHKGTDYAAPTGTPILATADGSVTKATRSGGNGIYVKLRHNATYETQYLHMSKIADGIRPGKRVKQGDVIGYVGSTGAATGPHVCYRFWKNGKQVDHRAEKFPASLPMKKELIPSYLSYIEPLKEEIDALQIIPYTASPENQEQVDTIEIID